MRIDDDNKVVWCSDENDLAFVENKTSIAIIEMLVGFDGSYSSCELENDFFDSSNTEKINLIKAIANNYKFEIEYKKYYWRKKKEYLAWFEKQENCYLSKDFIEQIKLSNLDDEGAYKYFKFTEDFARDILKDDFNMFEKVECE